MKRHAIILFLLVLLAGSLSMVQAGTLTVVYSQPGSDPASYGSPIILPTTTDNFGIEIIANVPIASTGLVFYNGNSCCSGWGIYTTSNEWYGLFGGVTFLGGGTETLNKNTDLALVDDNGLTTFYVNGVAMGTTTTSAPNAPGFTGVGNNLSIGEDANGNEVITGNLSDARIFTFPAGTFTPSQLQSVPEPSILALALVGLGGIVLAGGVRRRRAAC